MLDSLVGANVEFLRVAGRVATLRRVFHHDAFRGTLSAVAEDIRALVEHLGGKALIVGHDWGGAVAQAFALQHPEMVSGVILMNVPMIATFNGVIGANKEQPSLAVYTLPYLGYQPGDDKNVDFITRNIRDPEWRSTIANYLKEEPIESMFSLRIRKDPMVAVRKIKRGMIKLIIK